MKETLRVNLENDGLCLLNGITFAQVPYWFPFYNTRDLKLNIIRPFGPPKDRRPLLVWICGGGFITMDRSAHTPFLIHFAQRGYIVASVEYRRSNSAHYPAQLQDVKSAIRYLRAHAEAYGIDGDRVAVMGESAGGYLAAMAGATAHVAEFDVGEHLDQSSAVSAVVDYYGPASLSRADTGRAEDPMGRPRADQMLLGYTASCDPERAKQADAETFISGGTPPYFILHGTQDPVVPLAQSEFLYEKLQAAGVRSEFLEIEGAAHASPHFYQTEISDRILAFLDSILK